MKYAVLIPDGMADRPLAELDGRTPLDVADTPNMDALARAGMVGLVRTCPEGLPAGSEVANLAILGYDPLQYLTGRGPLEAAAMGITLAERDVAFRCNLVTSDGERLLDFAAGHVPTDQARELIRLVDDKLGTSRIKFVPGVSYRHLLLWEDGPWAVLTHPAHDVVGERLGDILPEGDQDQRLRQMIYDSLEILDDHEINRRRRGQGLGPANMIWPWGQGRRPDLPGLFERYGLTGAVICAVDLIKGIGRLAGLKHIPVPGATGYLDTDYAAKGRHAVEALGSFDLVYVHVEAPDEASHLGDAGRKIEAIERVDRDTLGTILDGRAHLGDVRVMVLPDHATPIGVIPPHQDDPVPFVISPRPPGQAGSAADRFSEAAAAETGLLIGQGHELMDLLVT